jgi:hypothetical protein
MKHRSTRLAAIAAGATVLLFVGGCATNRYDEVQSARDAYADCVDGWGADHERCVSLHEQLQGAEGRYRNPGGNPADDAWGR